VIVGLQPPDGVALVVVALAAWRLASLLNRERGPFDVFVRLRRCAGVEHDDAGVPLGWPDTTIGGMFACIWCMSIWTAAALMAVWIVGGMAGQCVNDVLAAGALAVLIDTLQERMARRGP
jgi:hypothetical protein